MSAYKDNFRTTILLFRNDESNFIDEIVTRLKKHGYRRATKSSLMRSAIRALMEKKLDISGIKTEEELVNRIVSNC